MKISILVLLALAVLFAPVIGLASTGHDHGAHNDGHSKTMEHGDHGTSDTHNAMSMDGGMAVVGSQVSKGVKGMAHIKDVSADMAKLGIESTHHFMMAFVDEETGQKVEMGTVALKITNPDAKVGETIELIGMDGHFGADIVLDMPGEYHFKLGTRLQDGVNRKYHFHYLNQ